LTAFAPSDSARLEKGRPMIRRTRNEEQPRPHVSSREDLPPLASRTMDHEWMTRVTRRRLSAGCAFRGHFTRTKGPDKFVAERQKSAKVRGGLRKPGKCQAVCQTAPRDNILKPHSFWGRQTVNIREFVGTSRLEEKGMFPCPWDNLVPLFCPPLLPSASSAAALRQVVL
jgi:hypothetical protein